MQALPDSLRSLIEKIAPPAEDLRQGAQDKMDNKTKPLGALGKLEDLAVQMSLIQKNLNPELKRKAVFVFAGDHGIAAEGVSAFPAEVTGQMVQNFLAGGAAINVICRYHGIDIKVVDMGVNADFENHPILLQKKVRKGTRNFAVENAMSGEEAAQALESGADVFQEAHRNQPIDIVGLGEMGIANTTSATAIICAVTGISPFKATGRGTGVDDKGLEHKAKVIQKALAFHTLDPADGFDILQRVGGFEVAGIAGAALAAAAQGTAVVLDGVISTAAGLIAYLINPDIRGYLIAGHRSVEVSQMAALAHMRLEPVIDFGMRLGEGTGAAMTIDVVDAACRIMREMASFDEAAVSHKSDAEL
jgi:nicotinate-nucleotide--dimethylbenzimidazole phosphoribosyltransferase